MKYIRLIILGLICINLSAANWKVETKKQITTLDKIKKLKPTINHKLAERIEDAIEKHCDKYKTDIVLAIIMRESSFRPKVVNEGFDTGLMQISPQSQKEYKETTKSLQNVERNIKVGCDILNKKYKWYWFHSSSYPLAKNYKNKIIKTVKEIRQYE